MRERKLRGEPIAYSAGFYTTGLLVSLKTVVQCCSVPAGGALVDGISHPTSRQIKSPRAQRSLPDWLAVSEDLILTPDPTEVYTNYHQISQKITHFVTDKVNKLYWIYSLHRCILGLIIYINQAVTLLC